MAENLDKSRFYYQFISFQVGMLTTTRLYFFFFDFSEDGLEVYVVSTVLALVERSCVAACLSGLTICAAELFPTVVRFVRATF